METIIKCSDCAYITNWKFSYVEHLKIHRITTYELLFDCTFILKEFKCSLCSNYQTVSNSDYNNHLRRFHKLEISEFGRLNLNNANNITLIKLKTFYKCHQCNYQTKIKNYLHQHRKNVHDIVKDKQCPHCTYSCAKTYHLKLHIINKHTPDEKIQWHYCDLCVFKFKQLAYLEKHILRKHAKEKNRTELKFSYCPHCKYKADRVSKLFRHINCQHKSDSEIIWYQCPYCSFKRKQSDKLKNHILSKHGKDDDQIDKCFVCSQCKFKTLRRLELYKHINKSHR